MYSGVSCYALLLQLHFKRTNTIKSILSNKTFYRDSINTHTQNLAQKEAWMKSG